MDLMSAKRMPKWKQILICSSVLLISILIGIAMIGKAEYDNQFCEAKLDLLPNEKAGLLKDYTNPYKEEISKEHGVNIYGCCKIPDDGSSIRKSQNCNMTPDYREPTISQRLAYFLKRFK